jgi:phage shock protein A
MEMEEEYEIIPTTPIRKLEQRISRVESTGSSAEVRKLIEEIIELIKSNQRVIDDVVKSDAELRNEMSRLPGKIDELLDSMRSFMDLLKASSTEETMGDMSRDMMEPLTKKMEELIDQNKKGIEVNQATLTSLGMIDKRLKRLGGSSEQQASPAYQRRY